MTKLAKRTLRKRKALIISGLNKEYSLQYAFLDVKENKQEVSILKMINMECACVGLLLIDA